MDMISNVNGRDEVMVVGEPAWHRKGIVLDDAPTSAEAIKAAGLDWGVDKHPVYRKLEDADGKLSYELISDNWVTGREDTWNSPSAEPFGIVGNRYECLQNTEAFDFFDSIVGEGAAIYQSAGALFQGKRIWIMAKLPDNIQVIGDDVVEQYLLLTNTHDGSSSVQAYFTPTRVVCWNTLSMSMGTAQREVRIRHTRSMRDNLASAAKLMGIVTAQSSEMSDVFKLMAQREVNSMDLKNYFNSLYPEPKGKDGEDPSPRSITNHANRLGTLTSIFESSPTIVDVPGARGTLWGAYNSVTQYVDHTQKDSNEDAHMQRVIFAGGRDVKIEAYDRAKTLVA